MMRQAVEHADEQGETAGKTMRWRGILAAAGTVVAGLMAKRTAEDSLVLANEGIWSLPYSGYTSASITAFTMKNGIGSGAYFEGLYNYSVYGYMPSGGGIGVQGYALAQSGIGVKGIAGQGYPVIGSVEGTGSATTVNAGVLGTGTKGPGVQGQSTGGYGLVGFTADTAGHAGLIGYAQNPGGIGLWGYAPGGTSPGVAGMFNGDVKITGGALHAPVVQAVVQHAGDKTARLLHTMSSPEGWIEDFGEANLTNGMATVTLDPDFAAVIETAGYQVFLTEYGDHHNLFVATRSATGFVVQAKEAEAAVGMKAPTKAVSGTFGYRVVAKRRDITSKRLAMTAAPLTPKLPTAFTVPETPEVTPPTRKP